MHSKLDLNLFVVLSAIYREGSITAAAQHLCLTQPAVSHALGRLRDMLDDPLFERHGRRMVPTGRCHQIMPQVQQAVDTLHLSVTKPWTGELAAVSRTVRIGLTDITESLLLTPLLRKIAVHAPRVNIKSMHIALEDMSEMLCKGDVDVTVDVIIPTQSDIVHKPVRKEPFVLLCRPDHPLRKRVTMSAYTTADHVLVSARGSVVNHVDMALARLGHHRHISMTCENFMAAADIAMHSDLLLTLPGVYADAVTRTVPLVKLALPFDIEALPVHMYWHVSTDKDPLMVSLRNWMAETLNDNSIM